MLVSTIITAVPDKPRRFSIADAAFAHAALMSAITQVDEVAGRSLHDAPRYKLFSCSLLPSPPSLVLIRLTFFTLAGLGLYQTLINALNANPTIRLGSAFCTVQSVEIAPSEWSGVATLTDIRDSPHAKNIDIHFMTPTAIMKSDGANKRYSFLLPEPSIVFLGLHRRWISLGGIELMPDLAASLHDGGCVISHHQIQTSSFHAPERLQIGFQGFVTYTIRDDRSEFAQALCALARLAHFTGVGYQTTRGMGLVQTRIG